MLIEYKEIGIVRDAGVWPQEIFHKIKIKKIRYNDDNDFQNALKEMPDYECWDDINKVLIKELK